MPRLTKKQKLNWAFFIDPVTHRRRYNLICRHCRNKCKQSYRAFIIQCPKYKSKRSR